MTFLMELKSGKVTEGRTYPKRSPKVYLDTKEFPNIEALRSFYNNQIQDPIVFEVWSDNSEQEVKDGHHS